MNQNQIDPLTNSALKNLVDNTPDARQVKNLMQDAVNKAAAPPAQESSENIVDFNYYPRKNSDHSEEWSVNFDITTTVGMEWRNTPYLVIQGPYTPICFNLRRAFMIGDNDAVGFGLKDRVVYVHMDPKEFPTEQDQQNLLIVAGKGDPRSGQ